MTAAADKSKDAEKDSKSNIPVPGSGDKKPVTASKTGAVKADDKKVADQRSTTEKEADKNADDSRPKGGQVEGDLEVLEDGDTLKYKGELYLSEKRVRNLIEDAREESESSSPAEESDDQTDPEDANDFLNKAWASLADELDDGVAKDQVLGALTAVQSRAREVVLEHAARHAQDN